MSSNQASRPSPFTGSIPRHYDEYLGPLFFEDYAIEMAARIEPSRIKDALELSCGTGRVTNHIRKALSPTGNFTASDLSAEMLEVAKEKVNDNRINWRIVDFTQIPFADASLDLVVCAFGYMFAENKVQAFTEAQRVLRPGGMLLFSTWDSLEANGASEVFRRTVKAYLGDSLPWTYNIPFSMSDPELINEQLRSAGFSTSKAEPVDKMSKCESARKATYGMVQGGSLYNEIIKRNPAWIGEISATVEKELSEKYGAAPMSAPMRAFIIQAWK